MKRLWNSFKIAFAMYSRLPMFQADWTPENMRYVMCFFPLIGIPEALLMLGWALLYPYVCTGSILKAAVFVLIPIIVTGGIHMDGFLDTADALSSQQPMEKKLEILKDSHAGAFAIIVGICYFVLAVGVFTEIDFREVMILGIGYVLSRSMSGLAVVTFPKARNSGLLYMFSDAAQKKTVQVWMVIYMILSAGAMIAVDPIRGGAAVLGAAITFAYYYLMSKKQFGGITGDLAGFFVQVCELVMAIFVLVAVRIFCQQVGITLI